MSDRSYRVRLDAAVSGFVAGFKQAELAVGQFMDKADKASQHIDTIGRGATRVGVVAAAGLGVAAKAAIDWESDWAGVTKTVDGSTAQMAALEGQLRGMAKTLPATHHEIAAVAEAAGQLGVRRDDIASFTKVMVDLGETTNLSADEASTSLAQFMNVMGTAPQDVGRLGASIVALGNDGASTEADIVSMAQRISGSGKIIGLSETQVLGYAAALSNVGIEAEAGGSAISTIFTKIDKAVSAGGDGLRDFATVSGLTADQFKQKFETDASGATQAFIEGLGRINAAGGDVNGTLETLGITEIRQRDAVLRLAASGTNLADSLSVSADGWRENSALVEEAAKRYATTESQIQIAWNNIKDAAITAGSEMLPAIAAIAEKASSVAEAFGNLPAPVKSAAVSVTGFVAVGGLVVGVAAKMVTSLAAARTAMLSLSASSTTAGAAMGAIGKAGAAGLAIAGVIAVTQAVNDFKAATSEADVSKLSGDLIRFGATGKATGELFKNFGSDFSGVDDIFGQKGPSLAKAMKNVADAGDGLKGKLVDFGSFIPSATNPLAPFNDELGQSRDRIKEMDQALSVLVEGGNKDQAAAAFEGLATQAGTAGVEVDKLKALFPEYGRAVAAAGVDAEVAGDKAAGAGAGNKTLAQSLEDTAKAAQQAKDDLAAYIAQLFQMPNMILSVRDAQRGVKAAIDGATDSLKENGKTLDTNTPKGRANEQSLDAIAASAIKLGEQYINSNASQKTMNAGMAEARTALVATAIRMGKTKEAAKAYADEVIKTPTKVATDFTNNAAPAQSPAKNAAAYAAILRGTLPAVPTTFMNNAGGQPKTAAERYAQILQGTLPTVQTSVTNTAKTATGVMAIYQDSLALTPKSKSTAVSTPGALNSQGQVNGLLGLLGALPSSKSITINTYKNMIETVKHVDIGVRLPGQSGADGGLFNGLTQSFADGKMPDQAMIQQAVPGGIFQWAEPETKGEAFIPLAPEKRARSTAILAKVAKAFGMDLVQSFANGGFSLPGGRLVDIAFLLKQLGVAFNPTAGVNYTSTLAAQNRANRAVVPARSAALGADRTEQAAKTQVAAIQRAITLQQRHVAELRKAGASDKTINAEQRKTIALQDKLYAAKKRVTAATAASNKADAVYKLRADAAKKATEAHAASVEKLIEQQKAAVEFADQIAQGLTGGANIGDLFAKSLTGKGLLADLQGKGAELKKFGALVASLRKQGLSEALIQQIVGKGAEQGTGVAQAILNGGLGLVAALNKAQKALDDQANLIGAGSAVAQYGGKVAGARASGGSVNAGMTYRINEKGQEFFTAPINGYVIPAAVDPNRYIGSLAGSGNAGSARVVREVHNHQHNTFHGVSMAEADLIAQRANAKADLMNKGY